MNTAGARYVGPRSSSDGSYIAYGYDLSRSGPGIPSKACTYWIPSVLPGNHNAILDCRPLSPPTGPWEWSPDGHLLAIGSYDGSIAIRSAQELGAFQRRLVTSEGLDVNSLAWSPDGEWIAAELGPDGRSGRNSVSSAGRREFPSTRAAICGGFVGSDLDRPRSLGECRCGAPPTAPETARQRVARLQRPPSGTTLRIDRY